MASQLPAEELWMTRRRLRMLPSTWGRRYSMRGIDEFGKLRFISGHYLGRSLEQLLSNRRVKRSVLLREPTSFMISYYNYRMMRYLSQGWKPYSFELHLRSLPCDPISHFLLERWLEIPWPAMMAMSLERKYDLLNEELSRFWYVADYKHCDELVELMGRELGVSTKPERLNTREEWVKKVEWQPLTADDLTASVRSEVAARTRLDQAIWQSWAKVRMNTSAVNIVGLERQNRLSFPLTEVKRPIHEIARRYQRGWF